MSDIFWLVANRASGSNSDDSLRAVLAAFAASGAAVARVADVAEGLPGPAALDAAGVNRLCVFAGDGTVNAVAMALEGWAGALLVLPGGTANLLARALHGEREAADIAREAAQMRSIRRPCIRGAGRTALVEVLAGPGANWSDVREELREGSVGKVAGAAVAAIRESTVGPAVVLADPPLGRTEGYSGVRLEVASGGMLVEGYGAETIGDYLKHGIALLRRDFREGPHDDLGLHPGVTCRSTDLAAMPLMIDGERHEAGGEQRFSLADFALDLLVSTP